MLRQEAFFVKTSMRVNCDINEEFKVEIMKYIHVL